MFILLYLLIVRTQYVVYTAEFRNKNRIMKMSSIFTKIIKGEIPCYKVAENRFSYRIFGY
jgi:hypothetical protein